MKEKAMLIVADPSKHSAVLGKFKNIDFKKRSIHSDIQKITPVKLQPGAMMKNTDDASLQAADFYKPRPIEKNVFSKMDLVLRKVHCVDETEPESGDDDMVLGGLKVGCSGNTAAGKSVASCQFNDGDFCDHGAVSLGGYSLNACSGYPKTFYFILQLLEVDGDQQEAALALTDIMEIVAAAVAGTGYGTAIAYVAEAVEILSGFFFDDDNVFRPYGVKLPLTDPSAFGSDGRSANKRTGNISDLGGTYRVGYYWQKRN